MLKPPTSSVKFARLSSIGHHIRRRTIGSFEYKLSSFYTYLTALSFCDFFSCIFAILNVLEYLPPPYQNTYSMKYREICLSLSLYTHPIAITLQALSVWIICAFSIHRSRSIIKRSIFFSNTVKMKDTLKSGIFPFIRKMFNNITFNQFKMDSHIENNSKTYEDEEANQEYGYLNSKIDVYEKNKPNYFFHIDLKNNFNCQTYEVKFYKKSIRNCFYCFCTFKSKYENTQNQNDDSIKLCRHRQKNELSSSRKTICILYLLAFVYLIPQMFEKKLIKMKIDGIIYVFLSVTQFGESRLFRQIFHLWFYLLFVYIIPFLLIFIFNFLLLRAFLDSKKRCQRYKLKLDPSIILKVLFFLTSLRFILEIFNEFINLNFIRS